MKRRSFSYWQAGLDFIFFTLAIWILVAVMPSLTDRYRELPLALLYPSLMALFLVGLMSVFKQYRFRPADRFLRQSLGAFNVVTLGFLLIVVAGFDMGAELMAVRGHLLLFLIGLLIATALSRIAHFLWLGRRPDFSLTEPVILKSETQSNGLKKAPLIFSASTSIEEVKQGIEKSDFDFALLTDDSGYFTGTVTDGDIIEELLKNENADRAVAEIMDCNHPVALETLTAGKMRQTMIERNLRFLPLLTNEGKPSRVVLLSDINAKYRLDKTHDQARTVLIIGGAGYIGSIMVRYLLKRGYKVMVLDSLLYGYDALKELDNHPAYRFIKGDARNIHDLLKSMEGVDAVIHLAAIVGDPACALNHRQTIDINYEASKLLVDACMHKKVKRLLFASSCSVYGASKNGELLNEQSLLNPVSLYAETRLRSEEAILNRAEPPLAVSMLRLATVFGFSYRPRFDLVVNILTARALQEGEISIFGGSQWRPNVHAYDVVRAFVGVMEAPRETVDRQVFNVGSESENYRISDLGDMVKKAIPETNVKMVEAEIDRRDYRVSFDKIEKSIGYKAQVSVRDGINEIIDAWEKKKFGHYSNRIYSNLKHLQ